MSDIGIDRLMMNTLPLFFKLEQRPVLIVGGGEVALRKAELLDSAGAYITFIAPSFEPRLREKFANNSVHRFQSFNRHTLKILFSSVAKPITTVSFTLITTRIFPLKSCDVTSAPSSTENLKPLFIHFSASIFFLLCEMLFIIRSSSKCSKLS